MEPPGGRDSRFNLGYSMNLLSGETPPEIYGNPNLGRPSTSLQQLSPRHTMVSSACNRGIKSDLYDDRGMSSQGMGLDNCVNDISEDTYSMQSKKSPPSNGKKTKGRVKIKMEYIENKLRRYTTFSKRKTGIMKKAYELSTLTGTQVMLLVASETGHVYTFATRKLQPMITSEAGKALIQTCLNSPDPPAGSAGGDQRMSATGFEETELTYNISDDDSKDAESGSSSSDEEIDTTENNLDHPDKIFNSQDPPVFTPIPQKCLTKNLDISSPPLTTMAHPTITQLDEEMPIVQSTRSVASSALEETTIAPSTTLASQSPTAVPSIPMVPPLVSMVPSLNTTRATLPSAPLMIPTTTSSSNVVGVPSNSTAGPSTGTLQAVPFLMQTPNGVGYVSTPDGMLLGLLQGPNMSQPQLVAIPLSSLGDITSNNVKEGSKNKDKDS